MTPATIGGQPLLSRPGHRSMLFLLLALTFLIPSIETALAHGVVEGEKGQQAGIYEGSQFITPSRRNEPACAFNAGSGVDHAIFSNEKRRVNSQGPLRIGIGGLGAGMLTANGRPEDLIRYYELNPAVADLANRHFSLLKDSLAKTEIALGVGRLVLEREAEAGARNASTSSS